MAKKKMVQSGDYVKGASASLNSTIGEIEDFLSGSNLLPTSSKLRAKLRANIEKLSKNWFRRGFRRGCIEMHKTGKLQKTLEYNANRDFYSGKKTPVKVKWKAK